MWNPYICGMPPPTCVVPLFSACTIVASMIELALVGANHFKPFIETNGLFARWVFLCSICKVLSDCYSLLSLDTQNVPTERRIVGAAGLIKHDHVYM